MSALRENLERSAQKPASIHCNKHQILESDFDARASGTDPLSRSEKERGCLRRAFERFTGRVSPLCALLGQMIRPIKPSVSECWRALRQLDNLEGIVLLLGTKFKTSLPADYRCLLPGF